MAKRAAIYIRVSTERQAEKVSPHEQEKACRAYCEQSGYAIMEVYRDIEKYRVGKRLVEPSGTRADRPQLRLMLAACEADAIDVIVAWREDRLYRGLRPMLEVIECIERTKVTIELVTESFDAKMAPIKAAIARMEIDAIKERHALGQAGRLADGKTQNGRAAYGYKVVDGRPEIEPSEAEWVQKVFEWYADGLGLREIRRRLVFGGAPQRQTSNFGQGKVRVDWAIPIFQRMLAYSTYWTGKQTATVIKQQYFDIDFPIIIDEGLAERVRKRREMRRQHPANNTKYPFLVAGLSYCQNCGIKLQAKSRIRNDPRKRMFNRLELRYSCKYYDIGYQDTGKLAGCCRTISAPKLDDLTWAKVAMVIKDDAVFEQLIRTKIEELEAQEADAHASVERIHRSLEGIATERHRIITWARKGSITEADMELQLGALAIEETHLKREFSEKSLLVGNNASKLREFLKHYRAKLREGLALLDTEPTTPEMVEKQYQLKRRIVETIVKRVEVRADKTPEVLLEFDSGDSNINLWSIEPTHSARWCDAGCGRAGAG